MPVFIVAGHEAVHDLLVLVRVGSSFRRLLARLSQWCTVVAVPLIWVCAGGQAATQTHDVTNHSESVERRLRRFMAGEERIVWMDNVSTMLVGHIFLHLPLRLERRRVPCVEVRHNNISRH